MQTLNMQKRVQRDFEIKNLDDYYYLYVQMIRYYQQIYLKTFETNVLKYMNLIFFTL